MNDEIQNCLESSWKFINLYFLFIISFAADWVWHIYTYTLLYRSVGLKPWLFSFSFFPFHLSFLSRLFLSRDMKALTYSFFIKYAQEYDTFTQMGMVTTCRIHHSVIDCWFSSVSLRVYATLLMDLHKTLMHLRVGTCVSNIPRPPIFHNQCRN